MLRYLRRRYEASVTHRINVAIRQLEQKRAAEPRGWSGSDPLELHSEAVIEALAQGVCAVYGYDVAGDIAEFGTMSGRTAAGLARSIVCCDKHLGYASQIYGHAQRKLLLFDSFAGLPEVEKESVDGKSPHVIDGVWGVGSLKGLSPDELRIMINPHLADDRFEIHPGWFSNTVPLLDPARRFALIHVDCDLYSSTVDVLEGLFSRGMVSKGAYIYFDDWSCNRADPEIGERRAWRECIERYAIESSDMGVYGMFSRRFVVHSYAGSPDDVPGPNLRS
jgi:hypothetical protein